MKLDRAHTFLIHPGKNQEDQPEISGAQVPSRGPLTTMLNKVFDKAEEECAIEIVFRPSDTRPPENECRNLLVTYCREPSIPHARLIATRLQQITTRRSGLGLLFIMKGSDNGRHKLVISRFPADQGVIAQENAQVLSVAFIERVFMKNARAYKSAFYTSDSLERGFWEGRAVDHQISGPRELSDYWIQEFLSSTLRTTGPAGTMRLAVAFRAAIRSSGGAVSQELLSAIGVLRGQNGRRRSTTETLSNLGLSTGSIDALKKVFPREDLMHEVFEFDSQEFQRHAPYRSVELDNGGMLIAEDSRFGEVFREQVLNAADKRVRYVTEGRIIDQRLRKAK